MTPIKTIAVGRCKVIIAAGGHGRRREYAVTSHAPNGYVTARSDVHDLRDAREDATILVHRARKNAGCRGGLAGARKRRRR